jgi:hypothetical protein
MGTQMQIALKVELWFLSVLVLLAGCVGPSTPAPATPTSPSIVSPSPTSFAVSSTLPSNACHIRAALPDPSCTPGVTNPDVTQSNLASTVCASNWTKSIRPSTAYTDKLKGQQIAQYGYTDTVPADYEEDHLISLELGGNPTDPRNLWPEPYNATPNAKNKDKVENYLKAQVCNGSMSLADVQNGISSDWTQYMSQVALSVQDISSDDPDDNGE